MELRQAKGVTQISRMDLMICELAVDSQTRHVGGNIESVSGPAVAPLLPVSGAANVDPASYFAGFSLKTRFERS
jgi:hypothetical protein